MSLLYLIYLGGHLISHGQTSYHKMRVCISQNSNKAYISQGEGFFFMCQQAVSESDCETRCDCKTDCFKCPWLLHYGPLKHTWSKIISPCRSWRSLHKYLQQTLGLWQVNYSVSCKMLGAKVLAGSCSGTVAWEIEETAWWKPFNAHRTTAQCSANFKPLNVTQDELNKNCMKTNSLWLYTHIHTQRNAKLTPW